MSQIEVQSAHWCHCQATVVTAHAWIDKETTENILISDDINHAKIKFKSLNRVNVEVKQRRCNYLLQS